MDSFKTNDVWLDAFCPRLMLYTPTLGNWFSCLMLFEDDNKLDLTLIPIEEKDDYFTNSDGLVAVLLDKDENQPEITPTDAQYWIKPPTSVTYDDCINEFWWVSTYVSKGLAKDEILFAIDHLNHTLRPILLQIMAWEIGHRQGYTFSLGKNYKFIDKHCLRCRNFFEPTAKPSQYKIITPIPLKMKKSHPISNPYSGNLMYNRNND